LVIALYLDFQILDPRGYVINTIYFFTIILNTKENLNITQYHAKYLAFELTRKHSSGDLGKLAASLQDAKVDLNPHQVEAALFAFQSPLSKGAILADEVGLGKTIEAGIILSQKWAERNRKLLIIAPANLRKQWNQELSDKFYLPSVILESKSFNDEINKRNLNPFNQESIIISSFQFIKSKAMYVNIVEWDLIIIDEAHRLRNVYKTSNKIGKAIKQAIAPFNKVLLTATPLQNSLLELYGLVSIIDEYSFGDIKSFKSQYSKLADEQNFDDLKQRLGNICKRTLRRQVSIYINYTNRIAIVEEFYPYQQENELYDLVSDYLRRPSLYALPASQRQLMTLILRKLLASSTFAISGTLEALSVKLENLLRDQENLNDPEFNFDYETYDELKDEWNDEDDEPIPPEPLTDEQIEEVKAELADLRHYKVLADAIRKNSKGEKLITALSKGFEKLQELGANQKALIFTESTRTQAYLKQILEANGYRDKIVLFNGSNNDPQSKKIYNNWIAKHKNTDRITGSRTADLRQALIDYFKNSATIMIATEAAAEGVNLQFCSLIVNYDLPWNPQRIEQRIGRCHRYGQKFDVVVVNFLNKANAADQRVYQLLDEKFKLFSGVFGASDEVLGSIESGVDFEKRIATIYQNCRTEQEISKAFDLLQQELEPDIERNIDNARKSLLENFDEEVHHKLKISLEKGKEYLNRYEQWLWSITKFYLREHAIFTDSDDSFTLKVHPFDKTQINLGPYRLLRTNNDRKKSDIDIAENTNIYRIGHPLAQQIIDACKIENTPPAKITFNYTDSGRIISVLKDLVGHTGWIQATLLTVSSFETEEFVVLSGLTDDGQELDQETCAKFFSLPGVIENQVFVPSEIEDKFNNSLYLQKCIILEDSMQRNAKYFDDEYAKLEKWADDMKFSLEKEIKDLDAEIKLRKAEARKILDLKIKVLEQRQIKDLEKKRNEKRRHLFESQDDIDAKKEKLLNNIENRLNQEVFESSLFVVNWGLY